MEPETIENPIRPLVKIEQLVKTYREGEFTVHAVDNVSLDIFRGEFTVIAGASGSGKTTLLNVIGGLDNPDSGRVMLEEKELTKMSEREKARERLRKIGYVFQSYNLLPVLSAWENIQLVLKLQGVEDSLHSGIIDPLFEEMGLAGLQNRFPSQLSGGQQQRVAVARALAGKPEIVLADEPTANLDSETSKSLLEMMHELNRKRKVTFLFSSHDSMVIEKADRVIRLLDGKIISDLIKEKPL